MASVKKIQLNRLESNLRNISSSGEKMKKVQEELEAMITEFGRERARYKTGEIAGDVFSGLTRDHERKVRAANKKIGSLVVISSTSLNRAMRIVSANKARKVKRKKATVKKKRAKKRRKIQKKRARKKKK